MAITPKNTQQAIALQMGWDGSGQGTGGEKAWAAALSPAARAQFDAAVQANAISPTATPQDTFDQALAYQKANGGASTPEFTALQNELMGLQKKAGGAGDLTSIGWSPNVTGGQWMGSKGGGLVGGTIPNLTPEETARFQQLYPTVNGEHKTWLAKSGIIPAAALTAITAGTIGAATGALPGTTGLGSVLSGTGVASPLADVASSAGSAAAPSSGSLGTILSGGGGAGGTGLSAGESALLSSADGSLASTGAGAAGTAGTGAAAGSTGIGSLLSGAKGLLGDASTLSSGTNLVSSLLNAGSSASNYATQDKIKNQLLDAQGKAIDLVTPYAAQGTAATGKINNIINETPDYTKKISDDISNGTLGGKFTTADFQADPGYQFRKDEGDKAAERSLGAMGLSQSGAAVKAAIARSQGLADQTYNDAFTRNQTEQNSLSSLLTGQQTKQDNLLTGQQDVGTNAASNLAGLLLGQGDINALSTVQKQNILTKLLSSLAGK